MAQQATHSTTQWTARWRAGRNGPLPAAQPREKFPPRHDDLDPARGLLLGALFGAALWSPILVVLVRFL
jgi:hypothetical protein